MIVLLPAPFSPRRATTSPPWMEKETRLFATTCEKSLVTSRISRKGASIRVTVFQRDFREKAREARKGA